MAAAGENPGGGRWGITAALDYSLKRWEALGRFLRHGDVSIDNNHVERMMRPWAMGRKAWLFCGSELAGQRTAMVMSLVQSAKLHGHLPWSYLKDVLERLQTHPNNRFDELLPHRWSPAETAQCPRMKNIEALIDDGGNITMGAIYPIKCAATAADGHNSVAMLVRREGETLNALLKRLDKAIGKFCDGGDAVDEVNDY